MTELLCGRERNWRGSGIDFVLFFIVAYVIYGSQPKVGASAETLVSFYDGDRTRILIAAVIFGLGVVSGFLYARSPATVSTSDRAAVPAS